MKELKKEPLRLTTKSSMFKCFFAFNRHSGIRILKLVLSQLLTIADFAARICKL